jgi:hypothetical protein
VITVEHDADGTAQALARVTVGVRTEVVRVPLGAWHGDVDPGGLRQTPVVVLTRPQLEPLVRTGAERAGRAGVATIGASEEPLGARLLREAGTAEVLVLVTDDASSGEALVVARALEGRPLPVVPFDNPAAGRAMLRDCWVDLDVAIPSVDGAVRDRVRDAADDLGLFVDHHVVEVDPRPALGDSDRPDAVDPTLRELSAAATGVLAGRLAVRNRSWRGDTGPSAP